MSNKDFFDVPQTNFSTSNGEVDLPILYYGGPAALIYYLCDYDKAAAKLYGTGFSAVKVFPNKAIIGLALFDYAKCSIGPYNEVGIGITCFPSNEKPPLLGPLDLLRKSSTRTVGFYILDLPVTTQVAHAAGRELWGFPKFVTEINLEFTQKYFKAAVLVPESSEAIFNCEGPSTGFVQSPGMDLVLYTNHENTIKRAIFDVKATTHVILKPKFTMRIGSTSHRMASNMRDLGLEKINPVAIQATNGFQSRLNAGQKIAVWKSPKLPYEK